MLAVCDYYTLFNTFNISKLCFMAQWGRNLGRQDAAFTHKVLPERRRLTSTTKTRPGLASLDKQKKETDYQ